MFIILSGSPSQSLPQIPDFSLFSVCPSPNLSQTRLYDFFSICYRLSPWPDFCSTFYYTEKEVREKNLSKVWRDRLLAPALAHHQIELVRG